MCQLGNECGGCVALGAESLATFAIGATGSHWQLAIGKTYHNLQPPQAMPSQAKPPD